MAGVDQRLADAATALAGLDEAFGRSEPDAIERDAAILRLLIAFEAVRRACKLLLSEIEGAVVASPGAAIRAAHEAGWLDAADAETALRLAADCERIPKMYRRGVADEIAARLPGDIAMLRRWLAAMRARAGGE